MNEKKAGRTWHIVAGALLLSLICMVGCYWRGQKTLSYEDAIEIAVQDAGLNRNSAHISCIHKEDQKEYEILISNSDYTQKYKYTISETGETHKN